MAATFKGRRRRRGGGSRYRSVPSAMCFPPDRKRMDSKWDRSGNLIYINYPIDVYLLGVKNYFYWHSYFCYSDSSFDRSKTKNCVFSCSTSLTMAPNISAATGVLHETDEEISVQHVLHEKSAETHKVRLVWRNIILFIYLHSLALYGLYLMFTSAKLATALWCEYLNFFRFARQFSEIASRCVRDRDFVAT